MSSEFGRFVSHGSRVTWERGTDTREWSALPIAIRMRVINEYYDGFRAQYQAKKEQQQNNYFEEARKVLALATKAQRITHLEAYRREHSPAEAFHVEHCAWSLWNASRRDSVDRQIELAGQA